MGISVGLAKLNGAMIDYGWKCRYSGGVEGYTQQYYEDCEKIAREALEREKSRKRRAESGGKSLFGLLKESQKYGEEELAKIQKKKRK